MIDVLGRFHLLLLHFPIALLLGALVVELAVRKLVPVEKRKEASLVVSVLLALAAAGAVVAAVTGLIYANHEEWHGYAETLINQHRAGGIATAVLAIGALVAQRKPALATAYLPVLGVACIGVLFTGHRGGELVHGEGYLWKGDGDEGKKDDEDLAGPVAPSDGDEASSEERARWPEGTVPDTVDYAKHIKPLIDRSCTKCHGPEKRKSGLRLDKKRFAMKGGETGPAIVPGDPAASLLYKYITLPPDDEDVMPSKGKLLAQSEIETIKKWIAAGATWPDDG